MKKILVGALLLISVNAFAYEMCNGAENIVVRHSGHKFYAKKKAFKKLNKEIEKFSLACHSQGGQFNLLSRPIVKRTSKLGSMRRYIASVRVICDNPICN